MKNLGGEKVRRNSFTMIEILISMGLAMSVLTLLMGFYAYVMYIGKKGDQLERKTIETFYLQSRLSGLIPEAIPYFKSTKSRKKEGEIKTEYNFFSSFLNGSSSLTFLFYNEASIDPQFSGNTLGKIYVNENKQLVFSMLPSPLKWGNNQNVPAKTEILASGVERMEISFFTPLEANRVELWKDMRVSSPRENENNNSLDFPPGQWVSEWKNSYKKLPPLVKLELIKKNETVTFIYRLPWSEYMIVYE